MKMEFPERNFFLESNENSKDLSLLIPRLFENQLQNWKLASDGYRSLEFVRKKSFEFDGYSIEAQYNSGRIISSSAKVDENSIKQRPCFLCSENLPIDQKAVKLYNNYILLVNPFPIFHKHFTIPSLEHIPQSIQFEFENFLNISFLLGKNYSVFYNGPKCGASAPDHLHFQAGNFGFMHIENELESILKKYSKLLLTDSEIEIFVVSDSLRNFFVLKGKNLSRLKFEFHRIYSVLSNNNSTEEPLLNIICNYTDECNILIFPRSKHRPSYFFAQGDGQILISPAAVDFGGVLIFPREEDFNKITKELVVDIFHQVTLDKDLFVHASQKLSKH
jgi:ATP adenylyltransferase/5',5'''-P-1,P-4-tetraphosphate phosphorylase II